MSFDLLGEKVYPRNLLCVDTGARLERAGVLRSLQTNGLSSPKTSVRYSHDIKKNLSFFPHILVRFGRRLRMLVVDSPFPFFHRHLAEGPGHLTDV